MDINNKVAIVLSNGLTRINLLIVQHLLRNGAEFVAIFDNSSGTNEEIDNLKTLKKEFSDDKYKMYTCDAGNFNQFEGCYIDVMDTKKHVDILIYNACLLHKSSSSCWEATELMKYNFNAVIKCSRYALSRMLPENGGKGGVIVNICSIFGLVVVKGAPVICAAEHAAIFFTRAMKQFKDGGVRVLSICPDATDPFCNDLVSNVYKKNIVDEFLNDKNVMARSKKYFNFDTPDDTVPAIINIIKNANSEEVFICQSAHQSIPVRKEDDVNKLLHFSEETK